MKAGGLMIGDWVLYHKTFDRDRYKKLIRPCDENIRIKSIVEEGVNEEYCQGDIDWIEYGELQPIPLTEDILKANGFENYCANEWRYSDKDVIISIWLHSKRTEIDTHNDSLILHIPYVHSLQHALRLCGLNELADNVKIN